MNRNQKKYDLAPLPKTNDKKAQRFLNPDGNAEHYQIPVSSLEKADPHQCGMIVVRDGFLVCTKGKMEHTIPVKNIDEFISKNKTLMAKHLQR